MLTLVLVLACVVLFFIWPFAVILGGVGFWLFGVWGAVVGVLAGLFLQAAA
jgi:hypothetical protein